MDANFLKDTMSAKKKLLATNNEYFIPFLMYFIYLRKTNYNNHIISLSSLTILYHSTRFNKVDQDKDDHNEYNEDKDNHNKDNLSKDTHNKVDHDGDKQNKDNSKDIRNFFFFLL